MLEAGAAMTSPWSRIPRTIPLAGDVSRRTLLAGIILGGATAAALSGCTVISGGVGSARTAGLRLSKEPAAGRERTIEMFNIWGGPTGNAWVSIAELYEKSQSHTAVKVTYAPVSANAQVRLLTAIAAGSAPDIAFVTPDQYPQFVGLDVITNLDPYLARYGIGEKDFVPAVWKQMSITGSVYSLPAMVDPNFPIFWNKKVFEEAGLDPDAGPETIDDVDRMSAKLLRRDGHRISRIGTIPWSYYTYGNSMFLLGFAFGGKFVNDDNTVVTADHDNNVQALAWMCDYAKRSGGAGNLAVTSPAQVLPVLAGGTIGMMPMTATDAGNVKDNAKDVVLGSAPFPYAAGLGSPGGSAFLGGWSTFVPKGSKHPDSAFDFIQFATATAEGTSENFAKQSAVSGFAPAPSLSKMAADPFFSIFTDVLFSAKNIAPTIPVASTLAKQLDISIGQAVFGQVTPKQALTKVSDIANTEWDAFRKEHPA